MDNTERTAYSKLTNRYDDVLTARKWWSRIYMNSLWKVDDNAVASEVLNILPNDFEGRILDLPVGTAVFTAAKYAQMSRASVLGLDYSQEMLDIAAERIAYEGLSNLQLQQGDVCQLDLPDESFEIVLSMNGLHAFPADKERALAEMCRVLKPGGLFCGCFYIRGERGIADFFVRQVLNKKGFFTPPHFTKSEATALLKRFYGEQVSVKNYRSILIFKCIKSSAPGAETAMEQAVLQTKQPSKTHEIL